MPGWLRKLISRKADADPATQTEYLISIPPTPPDYRKAIPRPITAKTGDIYTIHGKLARAEMAERRAKALHRAAIVSAEYARALSKITREAVACAEGRVEALSTPGSKAPPPPYQAPSTTPVSDAPIVNPDLCTIDVVLERARKASQDARDVYAKALEADTYTQKLAREARYKIDFANREVARLVK